MAGGSERAMWVPAGGPNSLEIVRCEAYAFGPEAVVRGSGVGAPGPAAEKPARDGTRQLRLPLGSWMLGLRALPPGEPGAPPGRMAAPERSDQRERVPPKVK